MRSYAVICALGVVALSACSQAPEASTGGETGAANRIDCLNPVTLDDTYASLAVAYGKNARLGMIPGPEGTESRGLILYPDLPERTLHVSFWDAALRHVSQVAPAADASAWTGPGGIRAGATLDDVEKVNGRPFTISGFGWDYGGYVTDFKGGRLDKLTGGCVLSLRFDGDALPDGVSGDGVMVDSNDPRLKDARVVVSDMSFGWRLSPGVTPFEGD